MVSLVEVVIVLYHNRHKLQLLSGAIMTARIVFTSPFGYDNALALRYPGYRGAGNYLNKDTDRTDVSAHNPKRGKGPRLG